MASILLADDHEVVRRGVRALLEAKRGFVICGEACNGREAVDMAVQHNPDVVVLDISLPALNGVDATRHIRKVAPKSEILIFTMHDSEEIIREALGAGARGCLLKSEADSQIVSAVDALARPRRGLHHLHAATRSQSVTLPRLPSRPGPRLPRAPGRRASSDCPPAR
jgi:DNA-binding NarL/FixJ family response regulator